MNEIKYTKVEVIASWHSITATLMSLNKSKKRSCPSLSSTHCINDMVYAQAISLLNWLSPELIFHGLMPFVLLIVFYWSLFSLNYNEPFALFD